MKKLFSVLVFILLGLGIWFFFIRSYDYEINFTTKTNRAHVYHQVVAVPSWDEFGKESVKITDTVLYNFIEQEIDKKDSPFILGWHFDKVSDTVTKIKVGVKSKEQSLKHRLKVIIGKSTLIKEVKENLIAFRSKIKDDQDRFKIHIDGIVESPAIHYLGMQVKSLRALKAGKMIEGNAILYPAIEDNNLVQNGKPFIKVHQWNPVSDEMTYEFGFPVKQNDSIAVANRDLFIAEIPAGKALKATYYGNYSRSDEAWFALLQYAETNNIKVSKQPLEIFYDNPMQGGDDKKWKAEVFLPIKE